ncbi:MAG: ClbS/DfsB family four-helix bundle protein [Anaerolineaceae bacterium]
MERKKILVNMLNLILAEELELYDHLSSQEREKTGQENDWSARDILNHISAWEEHTLQQISGAVTPTEQSDDIDAANAVLFHKYQNMSWEDTLQWRKNVIQAQLDQINQYSEEDLQNPNLYDWLEGRPMWRRIAGGSFLHPIIHLKDVYSKQGNRSKSIQLLKWIAEVASPLDASPDWQGTLTYNQACAFAIAGDEEAALEHLEKALRLAPNYAAWSKEDSDFAELRKNPKFDLVVDPFLNS